MRYAPWVAVMILGLAAGCDDSADDDEATGGGDVGGGGAGTTSSGTTSSGTSTGTGGTGGTGGFGNPPDECTEPDQYEGDPEVWDAIQKENIPCTENSDCCVVINGCLAEGQIVHASDYAKAQVAWPYCPYECLECLPPNIDVACVDGICVGEEAEWTGEMVSGTSHCGVDEEPLTITQPATAFGC